MGRSWTRETGSDQICWRHSLLPKPPSTRSYYAFFFFFNIYCIYLFGCARSWLHNLGSPFFAGACGTFSHSMGALSCGLSDLVSWPGIELRPSALGAWSLSHWTTREVSSRFKRLCPLSVRPPFSGPTGVEAPNSSFSQMLFSFLPLEAAVLTSCPDGCNGLEMGSPPPPHCFLLACPDPPSVLQPELSFKKSVKESVSGSSG